VTLWSSVWSATWNKEQYLPPKTFYLLTRLHGVISQKFTKWKFRVWQTEVRKWLSIRSSNALTLQSTVVTLCTARLTFNNSTLCPHSVFMYFVWIWEQTAIISLYSINWLVCIKETESVYCAVRTGSLSLSLSLSLSIYIYIYIYIYMYNSGYSVSSEGYGIAKVNLPIMSPVVTICTTRLTFNNSTLCPHSVFMCFVWIWEQTAIISLYSINWLVFVTEIKPSGHYMYHQVNIQQFYALPTQCICVFCVDLRTNSDYFPIQHWLTGFYNRDGVFTARYGLDI